MVDVSLEEYLVQKKIRFMLRNFASWDVTNSLRIVSHYSKTVEILLF